MPQTKEAVDHAKAADVPIIVAVNKMDKPAANPDRVMNEMSDLGLLPEEWGGETIFVKCSAKQGEGVQDILETIQVVAEMRELKANPKRNATGTVIEAKLDKGRGPVVTLLVQNGTLHTGDCIVVGACFGKVRKMTDDRGREIKEAKPSTPVEIIGLNDVPVMAIFKGTWNEDEPILVRVHSSCATGDILSSHRCDCGEQLHKAMEMIEKEGKGVVVYLNQEGRGIGLMEKMKAYKLQEDGMDTVDANLCLGHLADERDYGVGAQILRELGVHKMKLLTNNPVKRVGLEAYGLEIVENVPVETVPNPYNERYLRTKKERMGHTLHFNK